MSGLVLGVVGTLVVLLLASGVRQVVSPRPRSFTTTCSSAQVTGTIWLDGSAVFTSVAIVDPQKRTWRVRWGDYAEEIRSSTLTPDPVDRTERVVSTAQGLGDVDNGTSRTAEVRPYGQAGWCALDRRVLWFW